MRLTGVIISLFALTLLTACVETHNEISQQSLNDAYEGAPRAQMTRDDGSTSEVPFDRLQQHAAASEKKGPAPTILDPSETADL